ncbi:MAG: phosphatidylglycerol lysyltransferase domain-containing protein [Candidatus Firestonebacteria bacterium]|nr:phosphatidylglycerol lysyltransferase domain-containing protein [Candidatus Firestonebacteria bacterium]
MENLIKLTKQKLCAKCDICCRFPEETPNLKPTGFKLKKSGELFICEAFNLETGRCLKYSKRPFDCQIYPFAVARTPDNENIMLIIDNLCPAAAEIKTKKQILRSKLHAINPIEWEETFIPLKLLEDTKARTEVLNPLSATDLLFFNSYIPKRSNLSAFSFAYHFLWEDFFKFSWKIIDGALCVFAKDIDNTFMPLPPLSEKSVKPAVFERCFELMALQNKGKTESRIENIPEDTAKELEHEGFRIAKKDEEYLYKTEKLEGLSGDKYKHIRWLVNKFKKENNFSFVKYSGKYLNGCADLLFNWLEEKKKTAATDNEAFLLKNIDKAHKRALMNHASLGLEGRVLLADGKVAAYTFGTPLGKDTFCVMLEVTDHNIKGAAQYIFMKMACEFSKYKFMNTMGDEGIQSLRENKMHYHPMKTIPEYIIYNRR